MSTLCKTLCKTLLWVFTPLCTWAQTDYSLQLQSGALDNDAMAQPEEITLSQLDETRYGAYYYLLLQFSDIPDAAQRSALKESGVTLYTYIPNYAYIARVHQETDLKALPIRSVFLLSAKHKLSAALTAGDYPIYALTDEAIQLNVTLFPDLNQQPILTRLIDRGYTVSQDQDYLQVTLPLEDITWLAGQPYVKYLEAIPPEPQLEPDGLTARALQRLNQISRGPGNGLDGAGVQIALGDDGSINHPDLNDRIIDLTTTNFGDHAEMTAGILAGSGSIDPRAMGMAPASTLRLFDIDGYKHLFRAPQHYQQHRVVITSTSFGEGCGGLYTMNTRRLDRQVYTSPHLLHVFSAGNNATKACGNNYGKIASLNGIRFGNISGGMKAGKNVLAIGNVEAFDYLQIRSSRGPAADGRIKPDLCAMGQGQYTLAENGSYQFGSGTSAAAPSLAGSAALLYQAFRQKNNNQDPTSALVKALLLNTADDLGRPGPDYEFGWGRVNIARAVESLENNQYLSGSIRHAQSRTHSIQVPAGTGQLRVMVYWHDPAGSPLSGRALINDIDLQVATPNGQSIRPWRLSTVADRDSLLRPAWRGVDRFNNVEQVTINNPGAGPYKINLNGHLIPQGPQDYVVVYYFEKNGIAITYPAKGETLIPNKDAIIRWDATGQQGGYTLEFSANNGQSWTTVTNSIPANGHNTQWSVPNQPTGQARLRLSRGNQTAISESFAILATPKFTLAYHDDQHAIMEWESITGADVYDIFQLRNGRMEKIGSTTQRSYLLPQQTAGKNNWYSIRAKNSTSNASGQRATAQSYVHRFCDRQITLRLNFDFYPAETSWEITSENGDVFASGSGYDGQFANQQIELTECLPVGCFNFTIYDAFGDGICCANGEGYYQILNENGTLIASGGKFDAKETKSFCLTGQSTLAVEVQELQAISCPAGQNGTLSAIVSGNSGNVSYQWSNGATTPVITNLASGSYSVTITEGNATQSASYELTAPAPIEAFFIREHNDCHGANQGQINVLTQGGTPPYSYQWTTGQSSAQINDLPAGSYTVTITDSQNCILTQTTQINASSAITVAEKPSPPACWNSNDGSIELDIAGGESPYTVSWEDGSQGKARTNLPEGVFTYSVTDNKGCALQGTIRLTAPEKISLTLTQGETSCTTTPPSVFSQVTGGREPYTFVWSDGVTRANRSDLSSGVHTLTVTDANGCSTSQNIEIAETAPSLSVLINQSGVSCYNAQDGRIQAIVRGGQAPYSYTWQNSSYGDTPILTDLTAGNYQLTVTDAQGCSTSSQVVIRQPDSIDLRLDISPADCGESTGSARVMVRGGQLPYSFAWSNGSTNPLSGDLASGLHHVTVTDNNGCFATRAVTISEAEGPAVAIEKVNPSCSDTPDGRLQTMVSGGQRPYSYSWSAGGSLPVRSQLRAGSYAVTVTDATGCQTVVETQLVAPPAIDLQLQVRDVSCADGNDGHIATVSSGGTRPFTYTWSNGSSSPTATGLTAGTYELTVTDQAGCSQNETVTIEQPAPLSLTAIVSDQPCREEASGSISVSVAGGRHPYSYQWDNGQNTNQLSGLNPGTYTVQLTDAAGCTLEESFTIEEKTALAIDFETISPTCAAGDDGIIQTTVTGASTPLSYQWSNGSQEAALINVAAGTFQVTVSDANNCLRTATVTLDDPAPLQVNAEAIPASATEGAQINVTTSGGVAPYNYQWSNDATTRNLSNLTAGTYTLTVTDASGCTSVKAVTIQGIQTEYCDHKARNANYEWIESVAIGKFTKQSGSDNGYADFTGQVIGLKTGNNYRLLLEPGYSLRDYYENWYIWIDLNGDRDFEDEGELILQKNEKGLLHSTLSIPHLTRSLTTRMRVAMRFLPDTSPCGTFSYGEVEDYTVHLNAGNLTYCENRGTDSNADWIQAVRLNDIDQNSGNNGGYADFTNAPIYADLKQNARLALVLGNKRSRIDQYWRVWIDYNQNGDFSEDEIVLAEQARTIVTRTDVIWPEGLPNGQYRMRVLLKWGTPTMQSCGSVFWGEVEDYVLNLQRDAESWVPAVHPPENNHEEQAKVFPNPTTGLLSLAWQQQRAGSHRILIVNVFGEVVYRKDLDLDEGHQELQLNIGHLPAGLYHILLDTLRMPVTIIH